MAIVFGTPTTQGQTSGATNTFSFTVGAGANRLLLVSVHYRGLGNRPSSVTFGSQPLERAVRVLNGDRNSEVWHLSTPNVATANIVITFNGDAGHQVGAAVLASDAAAVLGVTSALSASGNGTEPLLDADQEAGEIIFAGVSVYPFGGAASPLNIVNGTELFEATSSGAPATAEIICAAGHTAPSPGIGRVNWTHGGPGDTWAIAGVTLGPPRSSYHLRGGTVL
jgi:hypothetical protein